MSSTTIRYSGVPENNHSGGPVDRASASSHGRFDPSIPGAYRYRENPDQCDPSAPASDPSSPRYEPDHLRHKPGDTWLIDHSRPYDPDDPGPFGSPNWRPDRRTGRHRRGELPDPLPPEHPEPDPEPAPSGSVPPWRPRTRTASPPPEPPEPPEDPGGSAGSILPIHPDRPSPKPRDRSRFWSEADQSNAQDGTRNPHRNSLHHNTSPYPEGDMTDRRTLEAEPFRFDKLREDAWDRFLDKSADLAAAHWRNRSVLSREGGWTFAMILGLFQRLIALFKHAAGAEAPQADPRPQPRHRLNRTARAAEPDRAPDPEHAVVNDRFGGRDATEQAETSDPTEPTSRADRERRTALAIQSARMATAVRGARRARAEKAESEPARTASAAAVSAAPTAGGSTGQPGGQTAGWFGDDPDAPSRRDPLQALETLGSKLTGHLTGHSSAQLPGSLPGRLTDRLTGGAAWA